jgi:hypothetical protein
MSFDPNELLVSFVASSVGLVLFIYGKKQSRMPQLWAGVLFMVYPYFTPNATWMLGVGVAIGVGLWWMIRSGW